MEHRSGRLGGYGKPELPKVLDLPARSRFGEGRAETSDRIIQMASKRWLSFVRFLHFHAIKYENPHSKALEVSLTGVPSHSISKS